MTVPKNPCRTGVILVEKAKLHGALRDHRLLLVTLLKRGGSLNHHPVSTFLHCSVSKDQGLLRFRPIHTNTPTSNTGQFKVCSFF